MGTRELYELLNTFGVVTRFMLDGNSQPRQTIEYFQHCMKIDAGWELTAFTIH